MFRTLGIAVVVAGLAVTSACATSSATGAQTDAKQVSVLPAGMSLSGKPGTPAPKPLAKHESLKVGIPSKLELEAPALLAKTYGEFSKENLDVSFVTDTVPNLLTLLGQNKIDLVYAGAQALVFNALH